jgi:diaminopimelate decarboxylase
LPAERATASILLSSEADSTLKQRTQQLKDKGIDITHLDLGGGVGIDYEGEQTIDVKAYVDAIISKVGLTEIILEPGRAIVDTN